MNNDFDRRLKPSNDGTDFVIGSYIYLAIPSTSNPTFKIMMKEVRFWSPMRTIPDLIYFQNRDLTSFNPVNLWAYWKIERDVYDLKSLIDKSPNGFGNPAIYNINDNWISNPDPNFAICGYLTVKGSSGGCSVESKLHINS